MYIFQAAQPAVESSCYCLCISQSYVSLLTFRSFLGLLHFTFLSHVFPFSQLEILQFEGKSFTLFYLFLQLIVFVSSSPPLQVLWDVEGVMGISDYFLPSVTEHWATVLQQQSSTLKSLIGCESALNTAHCKKEVSLHESPKPTIAVTCGCKNKY